MSVTDPIADLLTRMRNANQMRYNEVVVPSSNVKLTIVDILKKEGYMDFLEEMGREKPPFLIALMKI